MVIGLKFEFQHATLQIRRLVCYVCNESYESRSLSLTNHSYEVEQIKKLSVVAAGENKFIRGYTYSESGKNLLWVLLTVVGVAVVVAIGIIYYVRGNKDI